MTNNKKDPGFSITAFDTGLSFFVKWRQMDAMAKYWAERYFGRTMDAGTEREDESFYIALKDLKPSDFENFKRVFEQYDSDGYYYAEDEFPMPGSSYCSLPEEISHKIVFDLLEPYLRFRPAYTFATYGGVWFFRREPDDKEFDIRSYDVQQSATTKLQPGVVVVVEDGAVSDIRTNIPPEWGVDISVSDRDVAPGCSEEETAELEESFRETDEETHADGWYSALWL